MRERSRVLLGDKHLPIEIWEQILLHLPSKSLCKVRCVNREWCSLIDKPSFVTNHYDVYKNHPTKIEFLFCQEYNRLDRLFILRDIKSLKLSVLLMKTRCYDTVTRSVGSCRGLILMHNLSKSEAMLFNPSIRKALRMPKCTFQEFYYFSRYTLGYDKLSNGFKVICHQWPQFHRGFSELSFGVYSVNESTWVRKTCSIEYPIVDKIPVPLSDAIDVYSNGWSYWAAKTHVVGFDFHSERFYYLDWPSCEENGTMVNFLFKSGDSVGTFGISPSTTQIWILDTDTKVWQEQFKTRSDTTIYEIIKHEELRFKRIIYQESFELFMLSDTRLWRYDIMTNRILDVETSIGGCITYMDNHVETIVFGKGLQGQDLVPYP